MTDTREEALKRVPCIHYPIRFKKDVDKTPMQALINSKSEINAIHPFFAKQLGLPIRPIDIGAQKIDGIMLDTHGMMVAAFSVVNKANQVRFFEETFLVANVSPKVVFEMPFLTLSDADVDFLVWKLRWKTYTPKDAFLTTRRIELVGKKEFVAAALDPESETFVVHVASLRSNLPPSSSASQLKLDVHPSRRPQISGLIVEKTPMKVPAKYSNYTDVFSPSLTSKLPEHTGINVHAIELVEGQQPPYRPIYSLGPIELETLKTYIETNLANRFIKPSKSSAGAPILFDRKSDGSFRLCVNYWGLNNLTIKNQYLLPLIVESLDRLGRAKQFT